MRPSSDHAFTSSEAETLLKHYGPETDGLQAQQVDRFPRVDYPQVPCDPGWVSFAYPDGCHLTKVYRAPTHHHAVLTTSDGSQLFATFLQFLEPVQSVLLSLPHAALAPPSSAPQALIFVPRVIALVSVHSDPVNPLAQNDARAIGLHIPEWVKRKAGEVSVDPSRMTIAIVGDFNLPPPNHGTAVKTAAWEVLLGQGFQSVKEGRTPTNVVGQFRPDAPNHEYDDAFLKGAPGRAVARVIDVCREPYSRLAADIETASKAFAMLSRLSGA